MLQHQIINFSLYYSICYVVAYGGGGGALGGGKNRTKFQTCSSKCGCGRLWDVVAYKRFQI